MNRSCRSIFALALFGLFASSCLGGAAQVRPPEVFSTARVNAAPPAALQGRGVKRIRPVILNTGMFATARTPQRTSMTFFPGITVIVDWTQVERVNQPAGLAWTGRIQGTSASQATLVISGTNVTANVARGDLIYQIRTTADGRSWVREVDPREFPPESAPLPSGGPQ